MPKAPRPRPVDLAWAASSRSEQTLNLERAARLALELGDQALHPRRRGESKELALACDLYRRSAACSLRALALVPSSNAEVNDAIAREPRSSEAELQNVVEVIPPALLIEAAGSEERAHALSQVVAFRKFRSFATSDAAELTALAPELANFARKLLAALEARHWRIERPAVLRWLKLAALVVLATLAVVALVFGPEKWEASRDLAAGAPWKASSFYTGGCDSPTQDCAAGTTFFVHTLEEENPWLEFDLGNARSVSGVRVVNRTDCCIERARPLVVEVSSDHQHWREVARNTEKFTDWKTSFPTTQARWVRFEIPKRTNLHLRRVRIFP
ncbi:MAG TPA: discoidin domain-containing protein [Polyangiaceae bacterium]|nr:discoidin domain-containing protein [Polyangiaceae bacterium]